MDNLSVPVSVTIEGFALSLQQLEALKKGAVLELQESTESMPVKVMAGHSHVANGELVRIGNGMGVILTEFTS